mmetsp:Transcript_15319/g.47844  ORF Transcript_15319/g.47844 Transcript_15319/m.47844 type:complete len:237 (+) Transcript_15319:428-1138(+)
MTPTPSSSDRREAQSRDVGCSWRPVEQAKDAGGCPVDGCPGRVARPGDTGIEGKGAGGACDCGSSNDEESLRHQAERPHVDHLVWLVHKEDAVEVRCQRCDAWRVQAARVDARPLMVKQCDGVDAHPREVEAKGCCETDNRSRRTLVPTPVGTQGEQYMRQLYGRAKQLAGAGHTIVRWRRKAAAARCAIGKAAAFAASLVAARPTSPRRRSVQQQQRASEQSVGVGCCKPGEGLW